MSPATIIWRTGGWIGLIMVASMPQLLVGFGLFMMCRPNSDVLYLHGKH
ncbi:MAG TPA: hypothetical protein VMH92_02750 [Acidocella sp.]|nr:hypothetical protein [Acidocella sp.]